MTHYPFAHHESKSHFNGFFIVITLVIALTALFVFKGLDLFTTTGQVAGVSTFNLSESGTNALNNVEGNLTANSNYIPGVTSDIPTPTITSTSDNTSAIIVTPSVAVQALGSSVILPARTDKFEKTYYGFSLQASSQADLSDVNFQVINSDGSVSIMYKAELADDQVDREGNPISINRSELYLFDKGITGVNFFYSGSKTFNVNKVEDQDVSNPTIETLGIGDVTGNPFIDGNRTFKKSLMQAAGINIITRDQYGALPGNLFEDAWSPSYYKVNRIVIHHTATGVDMNNTANTVAAIYWDHTKQNLGTNYPLSGELPTKTYYEGVCHAKTGKFCTNTEIIAECNAAPGGNKCADKNLTAVGYDRLIDANSNVYVTQAHYAGYCQTKQGHACNDVEITAACREGNFGHDCTGRDWGDIGYNYIIDPYGNIYEGRAGMNGVQGTHATYNSNTIGISLLGNFTNQAPTQAALDAVAKLTAYLSDLNDIPLTWRTSYNVSNPASGIYPHRALASTSCPGNKFVDVLPQVVATASSIKNSNSALHEMMQGYKATANIGEINTIKGAKEFIIETKDLSTEIKAFLMSPSRRFAGVQQIGTKLIFRVSSNYAPQFLTEIKTAIPDSKIQPNYVYKMTAWDNSSPTRSIPSDYNATTHWNLEKIHAPEAWKTMGGCTSDNSCGGNTSVKVAVLDTGVAYEYYEYIVGSDADRIYEKNPEFSNITFSGGYDAAQDALCLGNIYGAEDYSCNDEENIKTSHGNDDYGHGTAVTSIIAANIDNGTDNSMLGIASNVTILPIKIFCPNDGTSYPYPEPATNKIICAADVTTTSLIIMGIEKAISEGANIINMSFGGHTNDPALEEEINKAYNAGIILIGASGNDGTNEVFYPAAYSNVLAVGSSTLSNQRYYDVISGKGSTYGLALDLMAPVGSGIQVNTYDCWGSSCETINVLNEFSNFGASGTSFAAPQVAAAVALIKTKFPTLTNQEIINRLIYYASDISNIGYDIYTGYGNLNISNALGNEVTPSITEINPNSGKIFGGTSVTITGSNFQPGIKVYFGDNEATNIIFNESGSIIVTTPSNSAGMIDVRVVNPNQKEGMLTNAFEYIITPPKKYYFPLYTNDNNLRRTWIEISNLENVPAKVIVKIGSRTFGQNNAPYNGSNPYIIPAFSRINPYYINITDGPVEIVSLESNELVVSRSELWGSVALSEMLSVPESDLSTKYYFSLYINDGSTWNNGWRSSFLQIANPTDTIAQVKVTLRENVYGQNGQPYNGSNPYIIQPHSRIDVFIPSVVAGPMLIESINDVKLVVSKRAHAYFMQSLSENTGFPIEKLSSRYYYPLYTNNDADRRTWLEISNLAATSTRVTIKIGDITYGSNDEVFTGSNPYIIPAFSRINPYFPNLTDGPVVIESLDNTNLIVSKSELWGDIALDEMFGLTDAQLSNKYYYSLYINDGSTWGNGWRSSFVQISNPSENVAQVKVTLKDKEYGSGNQLYTGSNPYIIQPHSRIDIFIPNVVTGPMIIESLNNVDLIVTKRAHAYFMRSLNETVGITNF